MMRMSISVLLMSIRVSLMSISVSLISMSGMKGIVFGVYVFISNRGIQLCEFKLK